MARMEKMETQVPTVCQDRTVLQEKKVPKVPQEKKETLVKLERLDRMASLENLVWKELRDFPEFKVCY